MAYYKEITSSQTWTCPQTGDYKIICVAGGGGLSETFTATSGGSTSFGTYMTCSGHIITNDPAMKTVYTAATWVNGYIPTRPDIYGTPNTPPYNTARTVGYGAAAYVNRANSAYFGLCGNIQKAIVHLEKGTKIACTIGAGGTVGGTGGTSYPGISGFISIQEV